MPDQTTDDAVDIDVDEVIRPITELLHEIRRGDLVTEASREFKELVETVTALGKKGKLTIELGVEMTGAKHHETAIQVTGSVKVKPPEPTLEASLFFVAPDGNATRNGRSLFNPEPAPTSVVDPETGELLEGGQR